jgi:hypothetical protein
MDGLDNVGVRDEGVEPLSVRCKVWIGFVGDKLGVGEDRAGLGLGHPEGHAAVECPPIGVPNMTLAGDHEGSGIEVGPLG